MNGPEQYQFSVEVDDTDNAAFGESEQERAAELARIMRDVAARLERGDDVGSLRDVNGNRVGRFELRMR